VPASQIKKMDMKNAMIKGFEDFRLKK